MDGSQEHAHGCLRTTLWRMPRLPVPVVEITSTHVALAELVGVDARELEGTAERVLQGCAPPPPGDVDWILEERDRISCAASPWRSVTGCADRYVTRSIAENDAGITPDSA